MSRRVNEYGEPIVDTALVVDTTTKERKRFCNNCGRNIVVPKKEYVERRCAIDGHKICYVEDFIGWCKRWVKEMRPKEAIQMWKENE